MALEGASGLIQKNADKTEFEKAIRTIEQGQRYYYNNLHLV